MIVKSLRTDEQWKKLIRIAKDMRHAGYEWSIVKKRLKCDVRHSNPAVVGRKSGPQKT